jgi:hypothetical protein
MATTQSIYPLDSGLTLAAGGKEWLEAHQQYIKPNTLRNYRAAIKCLVSRVAISPPPRCLRFVGIPPSTTRGAHVPFLWLEARRKPTRSGMSCVRRSPLSKRVRRWVFIGCR